LLCSACNMSLLWVLAELKHLKFWFAWWINCPEFHRHQTDSWLFVSFTFWSLRFV
jgi:hypothetical protein